MQSLPPLTATYRLQFTPRFGFSDAAAVLPYLHQLGISHIYASPVARARRGSSHGYDVCNPCEINPELGSAQEFDVLLEQVAQRSMGWVQDIVPNHMAWSHENPFLVDVLRYGRGSRYADFFDITWDHQYESLRGRVLAPFLGQPYGRCVTAGELSIVYEQESLWVAYYDQRYPLAPHSYWTVLAQDEEDAPELLPPDEYRDLFDTLRRLDREGSAERGAVPVDQFAWALERLRSCCSGSSAQPRWLQRRLELFTTGSPQANARFDALMGRQHFRLAYWKVAAEELNYRRFFTVSDLICIRIEQGYVFEQTHAMILDYVGRGLIQGMRIDHIDGLFDPGAYLKRLRERAPQAWIVVEKILEKTEELPREWPVDGTTGYDILNRLDYLLCDRSARARMTRFYDSFTGVSHDLTQLEREKKRLIIGRHMAGDIDNLAHLVIRIAGEDLMGRDITLHGLRRAIVEVLTNITVYRTYITPERFSRRDKDVIAHALSRSRETFAGLDVEFDFLERFLMMRGECVVSDECDEAWTHAVMRFQQFTGPLMAKGFEDTLFYVYNRHIALNEVGGSPREFGTGVREFHAFVAQRHLTHPRSMNASATHDTKRGEDTRARLQVLSELAPEWTRRVRAWARLNAPHRGGTRSEPLPDRNDEYLFYQTLAGTFPPSAVVDTAYVQRISEYMIKAVREAKVHTAWIRRDERYEEAVSAFVHRCLDPSHSREFLDDMAIFSGSIAWYGCLNSLTRTVLKALLPGIPDYYQGTEEWDLTMVDPDNRRAVDYARRAATLEQHDAAFSVSGLPSNDAVKLHLIHACLGLRRSFRTLFDGGEYHPLAAGGALRDHLVAFARREGGTTLTVVVPRLCARLVEPGSVPVGPAVWGDTCLRLPRWLCTGEARDVISGQALQLRSRTPAGELLSSFPVAIILGGPPVHSDATD